jgi:DNA-binding protein Fis
MQQFVDFFLQRNMSLEQVQSELMDAVLARSGQNVSEAARVLGVTRPQLRYRLKQVRSRPERGRP